MTHLVTSKVWDVDEHFTYLNQICGQDNTLKQVLEALTPPQSIS
jgi:hypothetical protein